MILLIVAAALAGKPKTLEVEGPAPYIPVTRQSFEDFQGKAYCLGEDSRGEPAVQPCRGGLAHMLSMATCDDGIDAYVCDDGAPTSPDVAWGLFVVDGEPLGLTDPAWYGLDHVVTAERAMRVADVAELEDAALLKLAGMCSDEATERLVVEVVLGCGKTRWFDAPDLSGIKIKTDFTDIPVRGEGTFLTDGADMGACDDSVPVGVRTVSVAEICATEVFPAAVARLRDRVTEAASSPDEKHEQFTAIAVDLEKVATGFEQNQASVDDGRVALMTTRERLGEVRLNVGVLKEAEDDHYVELFTELERLTAEVGESMVVMASLEDRAAALASEGAALGERLAAPTVDVIQLRTLARETASLLARSRSLQDDLRKARERAANAQRDVGFLDGRVTVIKSQIEAE